jgi:hypothetical protein
MKGRAGMNTIAQPIPFRRRAGGSPRSWNYHLHFLSVLGSRCRHCMAQAQYLVRFQAPTNQSGVIKWHAHPLCVTHGNQVAAQRVIENWPTFIVEAAVALANGNGREGGPHG